MSDTLNWMFQKSVQKFADSPALSSKKNKSAGEYQAITYREMGEKVRALASGLVALGVEKGDRIALISENRPEWAIADIGMVHIGAINVAIFPTLPPGQVQYIVEDSESKIVFVSSKGQLAKALEVKKAVPALRIITMDCPADADNDVITFDDVIQHGEDSPLSDADYEQRWRSVQPDDWASIIYTSGTTGDPKGAILSHHNFASNVEAAQDVLTHQPGDVLLSIAPLNHVMGRLGDHYLPLSCGAMVAYVQNLRRVKQNMTEVKPHYMTLVPRFFELFQAGILANIAKESPIKKGIFHWALWVGKRRSRWTQTGRGVSPLLALQERLVDRLVFSKVREQLGLIRLKLFLSGSAPLPVDTAEFFDAIGLKILEGYGLTETSPLVAVNRPHRIKFGTVGPPVKDVEVNIVEFDKERDDGEILVRGPNVMQGYYNKPDKTAEAIDDDGWFHTGDIGKFDEDGYLKITDRMKDLIVLSGGKKVAPQPIENRFKESLYISQVILVGDNQKHVGALIVPAFGQVKDWVENHGIGVNSKDTGELAEHLEVNRLFRDEIQRLSGRLADYSELADYEKISCFKLVDDEFTVENGMMTPTLKVKRRVVMEEYKDVIEAMYR
ncbi:MAG: AMP-dependent synthetase/ligase [Candidatus Bipolaricaulia bacterium]